MGKKMRKLLAMLLVLTLISADAAVIAEEIAELILPSALQIIDEEAFCGNTSIEKVVVPDGAKEIRSKAFADSSLKEIELPDTLTSIAEDAFDGCEDFEIAAEEGSYAYEWAVEKGYIESTLTPNPASDFEYSIFDGECEITGYVGSSTEVVIPKEIEGASVTSIGDDAFCWCQSLTSITIPDSVTYIGEWAFNGCWTLTSITIPESVTYIGEWAFGQCDSLTKITVDEDNTAYSSEDGVLFSKDQSTLICCPPQIPMETYSIPNSVTCIADYAFDGCWLANITIPDGVIDIGECAFEDCDCLDNITIPKSITSIGDGAFGNCDCLVEITVDEDNTDYSSEDGILFSKDQSTLICCPPKIPMETYSIPNSVTCIADEAFWYCERLTSITIPEGVTSIGDGAFWYCERLTSITIPEGVTSIGDGAFCGCYSLTSITIPEGVNYIGYATFAYCSSLTSIIIPDGVTYIEWEAFEYCSSLTSILIPESVTEIDSSAFYNCNKNLIIYGEAGSYAETYASEQGITFSTHWYEEVILPKEAITIDGRVCLEDGSGLSGVKVTICYNKDVYAGSAETDSDGYWSCGGLRPNQEYTICYDCEGYGIATSTCVARYDSIVLEDVTAVADMAEAIRFTQPLHGENVSPYESLHLAWTPVEGAEYYEYSARYLEDEEAFIFRRKTESTEATIPITDMREDDTLQLWVAAFADSDDEMLSQQIIRVTTNAPAEIPEHTCEYGEEYNIGENWYRKCTICGITIACTKPEAGDSVCEHGNLRSCCCICVGYHDWVEDKAEMGAGDAGFTWYHCARCEESINYPEASSEFGIYCCALEKIPENGNELDDSIVVEYLCAKMDGYVSEKNQNAILSALRKASSVYRKLYLYSIAEYDYELTDGTMQYAQSIFYHVIRINEATYSDTNEFLSAWFHEVGHAIDANSGATNTYKTNDTAIINGVEQNELFFYLMLDAKNFICKCIYELEENGTLEYTLTSEECVTIASAILDPNKDKFFDSERLDNVVKLLCFFKNDEMGALLKAANYEYTYRDNDDVLLFANSQMVQDILGGLSNNYIACDYGHGGAYGSTNEYWYKDGEPTYKQCQEAFAEFFSAQILGIEVIKNFNAAVFPFGTMRMKSMCSKLKESYRKEHGIAA